MNLTCSSCGRTIEARLIVADTREADDEGYHNDCYVWGLETGRYHERDVDRTTRQGHVESVPVLCGPMEEDLETDS